jgi:hypothetical protein
MAYIGKQGISSTTLTSKTLTTMVGNGSTDTLTLSPAPDSVNDVAIYLDGVFQTPGTEYTLAGSTITFTTAPANNVFVCALVGGGEHIGTPMDNSIGTDKLVDGTLTNAKIDAVSTSKISGTLPAINANAVTGLNAANLVGSMPAIDGSNLTGISSFTKNANDPAGNTNGTLGDIWANTTSGELYVLTDATTNANVWTNVGGGTGDVVPFQGMVATGGVVPGGTIDGDYKYHVFNSSSDGPFVVTTVGDIGTVDYLVIAGGGGGAGCVHGDASSPGGAGGYRTSWNSESSGGGASAESALSVTATSYPITVGAGGAGGPASAGRGSAGQNSVFSSITSIGGGEGAYYASQTGGVGGSGGGNYYARALSAGAGTANQGYAGGSGGGGLSQGSGGGGGAGAVGGNGSGTASSSVGGAGGNGVASTITGSSVTRAGGGGGSIYVGGTVGAGGSGGGGTGASNATPGSGTVNTGSGGGGVGSNTGARVGGAGGSGIVILRYKFQ